MAGQTVVPGRHSHCCMAARLHSEGFQPDLTFRSKETGALTSASTPVGGHGVSAGRAGTLIAAGDVDAFEGAEVTHALGALIDVCKPSRRRSET